MSYKISSYLVDINELRNIYGSQDYTLMSNIEVEFSNEISELNEWLQEDWDDGTPNIRDVLRENINGKFPWKYYQAPYKEVLELICRQVGVKLPNNYFIDLDPHSVEFLEMENVDISSLIFGSSSPVNIPGIEEEKMYRVGHITPEISGQLLGSRDRMDTHIEKEQGDYKWRQLVSEQFREWLELSVQYNKSIVTFFY